MITSFYSAFCAIIVLNKIISQDKTLNFEALTNYIYICGDTQNEHSKSKIIRKKNILFTLIKVLQ